MADADEDALPRHFPSSSHLPNTTDTDLSDEAQDFRFLSAPNPLSSSSASSDPTIPKRGEKDFEPLSLQSQTAALDASRRAMHNALSWPRVHTPKNHVVGYYLDERREGEWRGGRCIRVDNFRGVYGRTMGQGDERNRTWLFPEEALFLLERGSLDVRWPVEKEISGEGREAESEQEGDDEQQGMAEEDGLPMSLQGAYASFIGKTGLTLERYVVFAGLRRSGYVVTRAPTWDERDIGSNGDSRPPERIRSMPQSAPTPPVRSASGVAGLVNRLLTWLMDLRRGDACPSFGPLVAPGLHRNYNDIFRALALVPYYDQPSQPWLHLQPGPPFRIAYHVYKPSTTYRKSSPPTPDFRVAVIDARNSVVPTMQEIGTLLDSMPSDELPKDKRLEQRIKYGKKNVILAVVDSGVVSYLRFSEAGFGSVKLFEEKASRPGKKGGQRRKK